MSRDIVRFRRAIKRPTALVTEGFDYQVGQRPILRNLTPAALATLADADCDGLLMLPLVLYLGGDIAQIDSEGRSLLHFACTRRVARYLIEEGVPVAHGMRKSLIDAFKAPPGTGTFAKGTRLGTQDRRGREPAILDAVRRGTAARHATPESVVIPKTRWKSTVNEHVYNGMLGLGYNEGYAVRAARDPQAKDKRPTLRAKLSANFALGDALHACDGPKLRALLAAGADPSRCQFTREVPSDGHVHYIKGLSALAVAVLTDCARIEDERGTLEDDDPARSKPVRERELLVSHLARVGNLSGVHGSGGVSLMHLAREGQVAQWLIDHGAPCNVLDAKGKLPRDILPADVAAIVDRHLLESELAAATKATSSRMRL